MVCIFSLFPSPQPVLYSVRHSSVRLIPTMMFRGKSFSGWLGLENLSYDTLELSQQKRQLIWSWRGGSVVMSTDWSSRGLEVWFSAPIWQLMTICNSSPGNPVPTSGLHVHQTRMHDKHPYINVIKIEGDIGGCCCCCCFVFVVWLVCFSFDSCRMGLPELQNCKLNNPLFKSP